MTFVEQEVVPVYDPAGQRRTIAEKMPVTWLDGVALRDWFAGQALSWAGHDNWTSSTPKHLAERAYQMADAMLAARGAK